MNTPEEFWAVVEKGPECWVWVGKRKANPRTYATVRWQGLKTDAHRVAYELATGQRPPRRTKARDSAVVLHSCDNPRCVRPEHLRLGTQADNARDRVERGRSKNVPKGENHYNAKLTAADVLGIREALKRGVSQRVIAQAYGVTDPAISYVNTGKTWSHV